MATKFFPLVHLMKKKEKKKETHPDLKTQASINVLEGILSHVSLKKCRL